ncbi:hypothetical protein Tco_0076548 [Tanacetum coccineum]
MHIMNDPSFFLTNRTGAPQGEELVLINPLSESSCSCSDNSFISDGANRYGARATGAAPWNSVDLEFHWSSQRKTWQVLGKYLRKISNDRYVFEFLSF